MTVNQERTFLHVLGKRMRVTREVLAGASQEQVANALGVDTTTYTKWEGGSRPIPVEVLARFAAAARVSADWLMFGYVDQLAVLDRKEVQSHAQELIRVREPERFAPVSSQKGKPEGERSSREEPEANHDGEQQPTTDDLTWNSHGQQRRPLPIGRR